MNNAGADERAGQERSNSRLDKREFPGDWRIKGDDEERRPTFVPTISPPSFDLFLVAAATAAATAAVAVPFSPGLFAPAARFLRFGVSRCATSRRTHTCMHERENARTKEEANFLNLLVYI